MPMHNRPIRRRPRRAAFSLMELLVVVIILGTIATMVLPRVTGSTQSAKQVADRANRAQINAAVERWRLEKDEWPENDLSDIGADPEYFPEGIPTNPITGWAYTLNGSTHRVSTGGGGK